MTYLDTCPTSPESCCVQKSSIKQPLTLNIFRHVWSQVSCNTNPRFVQILILQQLCPDLAPETSVLFTEQQVSVRRLVSGCAFRFQFRCCHALPERCSFGSFYGAKPGESLDLRSWKRETELLSQAQPKKTWKGQFGSGAIWYVYVFSCTSTNLLTHWTYTMQATIDCFPLPERRVEDW